MTHLHVTHECIYRRILHTLFSKKHVTHPHVTCSFTRYTRPYMQEGATQPFFQNMTYLHVRRRIYAWNSSIHKAGWHTLLFRDITWLVHMWHTLFICDTQICIQEGGTRPFSKSTSRNFSSVLPTCQVYRYICVCICIYVCVYDCANSSCVRLTWLVYRYIYIYIYVFVCVCICTSI